MLDRLNPLPREGLSDVPKVAAQVVGPLERLAGVLRASPRDGEGVEDRHVAHAEAERPDHCSGEVPCRSGGHVDHELDEAVHLACRAALPRLVSDSVEGVVDLRGGWLLPPKLLHLLPLQSRLRRVADVPRLSYKLLHLRLREPRRLDDGLDDALLRHPDLGLTRPIGVNLPLSEVDDLSHLVGFSLLEKLREYGGHLEPLRRCLKLDVGLHEGVVEHCYR